MPESPKTTATPSHIQVVRLSVFFDILGIGLWRPEDFFVPIIGALRDCCSRRPVLLLCGLGLRLNFRMLTRISLIFWMRIVRAIGGAVAGNLSVASVYIAEV